MKLLHSILNDKKKRVLLIFYLVCLLFIYISLCNIRVGSIAKGAVNFSELNQLVETDAFKRTLLGRVLVVQFGFEHSFFSYLSVIEFPQIYIFIYALMYLSITPLANEKKARNFFFLLLSILVIQYCAIGIVGVLTLRTLDVGLVFRNIQMISNIAIYGGIIHILVVVICGYILYDSKESQSDVSE